MVTMADFDLEQLIREVNILLISDLHYDAEKNKVTVVGKLSLSETVNEALVQSLPENGDWKPNIVIIAGDLVNQGRESGYDQYFDLIQRLIIKFPTLKTAVFSTPGNHDINRENIVAAWQYLYSYKKINPKAERKDAFTNNEIINTIYAVSQYSLDDPDKNGFDKFIKQFEQEYFKTYLAKEKEIVANNILGITNRHPVYKDLETAYTKDILGIKLASINSSFFCNFSNTQNDRNNLFYIRDMVTAMAKELEETTCPVVTFMHHPFFHMHESEYIYPIGKDGNNFNRIAEVSDIILAGHVHGELHEPSLINQKVYTVVNGCTFTHDKIDNKSYPFTYAIIKINKQLNKFKLKSYQYNGQTKVFEAKGNQDVYYPFQHRANLVRSSEELEKVKIIRYLIAEIVALSGTHGDVLEKEVVKEQLKMIFKKNKTNFFNNKFRLGKSKSFRYYKFKNPGNSHIWVVKIQAEKQIDLLHDFLSRQLPNRGKPLIFFAIGINSTLVKSGKLLAASLYKVNQDMKSAVLSSKYDNCQLDFIYY